jgi:hypothetical protein
MFDRNPSGKYLFKTMCKAFDKNNIKYEAAVKDLRIYIPCEDGGNSHPVIISVDNKTPSIEYKCKSTFECPEFQYSEALTKLSVLNASIGFGAFALNEENGWIFFRYGYIFADADPGKNLMLSLPSMDAETMSKHGKLLNSYVSDSIDSNTPVFG